MTCNWRGYEEYDSLKIYKKLDLKNDFFQTYLKLVFLFLFFNKFNN